MKTAPRPLLVPLALVSAAVLSIVSVALQPVLPADHAERLAALDSAGSRAVVSGVAFLLSQAPMFVVFVGVAALVNRNSRRLAFIGAFLGCLGAFGHTVLGGLTLAYLQMATDPSHRAAYARLYAGIESSPVMLFALAGLIGTVLGLLLLSIALFRSRAVPRWAPALLWAFLLLEFAGSGITEYASYVAGLCLLVAFARIAATVRHGRASSGPPVAADVPVAA